MKEAEVKTVLRQMGWTEDRYGNFKSAKGTVRVKLQATSIRVERLYKPSKTDYGYQPPKEWLNIVSDYYKYLSVKDGRLVIKGKILVAQEAHLPNAVKESVCPA